MTHAQYIFDFLKFKSKDDKRLPISLKERRVILSENTSNSGFDRHYIYHPAWAARILKKLSVKKHIDISSTLYFSSIISAFIEVEFYDFRPADLNLSNLKSSNADLTNLHFKSNSVNSISCMHTVEHIGLGRYGDKIDPKGDIKAMSELKRVLKKGGSLLFVVPIGRPRIIFNAHRVYARKQIVNEFKELTLRELMVIPDIKYSKYPVYNPSDAFCNKQEYACGCFWFTKKQ